jgi:hypothetical protein
MGLQRGRVRVDGGRTKGFRVWIVACGTWRPRHPRDQPLEAVALEPAEEGILSARQAARYVKAFNRTARAQRLAVWAIALPVTVRYEGDLRRGDKLIVRRTL